MNTGNHSNILHQETLPTMYFLVVYPILAVGILFGNGLTIAAVAKYNKLQTITNAGIVNLAVSDFLVGLEILISGALGGLGHTKVICIFSVVMLSISMSVSLQTLGFVTVDRFVAIVKPLRYEAIVTRKVVLISLIAIWAWPVILAQGFIFWHHFDETGGLCRLEIFPLPLAVLCMIVPICVITPLIIIMYIKIFAVAYQHSKKIHAMQNLDGHDSTMRNVKAAKVLAIVVGAFGVSWLPFLTACTIQICTQIRSLEILWFNDITLQLVIINSSLNPLIYAWKNEELRTQFRKMLCRKRMIAKREQPPKIQIIEVE